MSRVARALFRKMSVVGILMLTLVFAAPAFESHACAEEVPAAVQIVDNAAPADDGCPDCGPACANGCCHAAHCAIAPDVSILRAPVVFEAPPAWSHVAGRPLDRPAGPDRPPRA